MILRPSELLTTILIGNNVANILAGAITTSIASKLTGSTTIGVALGMTTVITILFGEIIPKTFARNHAERFAVIVIRMLQVLFIFFTQLLNQLFGSLARYWVIVQK